MACGGSGPHGARPPRARISTPDSAVSVRVIPTNEELMIAQHTLAFIRLTSELIEGKFA
jgi:acetate kinase